MADDGLKTTPVHMHEYSRKKEFECVRQSWIVIEKAVRSTRMGIAH